MSHFCLDLKNEICEYNDEIEAEDKIFYYKCKKIFNYIIEMKKQVIL